MDDDRPPVIAPPVRRDPNLSINGHGGGVATPIDAAGRPRTVARETPVAVIARFMILCTAVVAAAIIGIIACGFVARAIWHALRIGWSVG